MFSTLAYINIPCAVALSVAWACYLRRRTDAAVSVLEFQGWRYEPSRMDVARSRVRIPMEIDTTGEETHTTIDVRHFNERLAL